MADRAYKDTDLMFGRFAGLSTKILREQPVLILTRMAGIDAKRGLTKTDQVRLAKIIAPLSMDERLALSAAIGRGRDVGFTIQEIIPLSGRVMNAAFPLPSLHHIKLEPQQAQHVLNVIANPEVVLADNQGIARSALALLCRDKLLGRG